MTLHHEFYVNYAVYEQNDNVSSYCSIGLFQLYAIGVPKLWVAGNCYQYEQFLHSTWQIADFFSSSVFLLLATFFFFLVSFCARDSLFISWMLTTFRTLCIGGLIGDNCNHEKINVHRFENNRNFIVQTQDWLKGPSIDAPPTPHFAQP